MSIIKVVKLDGRETEWFDAPEQWGCSGLSADVIAELLVSGEIAQVCGLGNRLQNIMAVWGGTHFV